MRVKFPLDLCNGCIQLYETFGETPSAIIFRQLPLWPPATGQGLCPRSLCFVWRCFTRPDQWFPSDCRQCYRFLRPKSKGARLQMERVALSVLLDDLGRWRHAAVLRIGRVSRTGFHRRRREAWCLGSFERLWQSGSWAWVRYVQDHCTWFAHTEPNHELLSLCHWSLCAMSDGGRESRWFGKGNSL